jgi:hypothetical protein
MARITTVAISFYLLLFLSGSRRGHGLVKRIDPDGIEAFDPGQDRRSTNRIVLPRFLVETAVSLLDIMTVNGHARPANSAFI